MSQILQAQIFSFSKNGDYKDDTKKKKKNYEDNAIDNNSKGQEQWQKF